MTETKETLEKALAEMKQRGRTRKSLLSPDGKCCALGAVGLAREIRSDHLMVGHYEAYDALKVDPAVSALAAQVPVDDDRDYCGEPHWLVYNFNDTETTTDQQVYDLFERAIAALA